LNKSWLDENKVTKENVALLRYNSGAWKELATTIKSEDGSSVNFEATTPGFSYFAIGQKGVATTVAPSTGTETTTPAVGAGATETTPTAEVTPEQTTTPRSLTWLWVVIGVVALIALLGIYSYIRKRE